MDSQTTKQHEMQRHDKGGGDGGYHSLVDMACYSKMARMGDVQAMHDTIDAHLPAGGVILDLGGGDGLHGNRIVNRHADAIYTNIEISREQLREAASHTPTAEGLVWGDAETLPFADDSVDVVVSCLALHHLPNWRTTALDEIARVLADDGTLVVREPARYNPLMWTYRRLFETRDRSDAEVPMDINTLERELDRRFDDVSLHGHYIVAPLLPVIQGQTPIEVPDWLLSGVIRAERAILDNGGRRLAAEVVGAASTPT